MSENQSVKGMLFASAGVFMLSFDALLVRLSGTSASNVAFWRGTFICLALCVLMLTQRRRISPMLAAMRRHWKMSILLMVLYAFNSILFVFAVQLTSVANTVVILSCASFFAALFTWFLLKHPVQIRTRWAILASLCGVGIVFSGTERGENLTGDLVALSLAILMGLILTLLRKVPDMPRNPVIAGSGLFAALFLLPFAAPTTLADSSYFWLGVMGLVQMPISMILIMQSTRFISSPEVSLFLLIETILGPVWVWCIFAEPVPIPTLIGGSVILAAVATHAWLNLKEQREAIKVIV